MKDGFQPQTGGEVDESCNSGASSISVWIAFPARFWPGVWLKRQLDNADYWINDVACDGVIDAVPSEGMVHPKRGPDVVTGGGGIRFDIRDLALAGEWRRFWPGRVTRVATGGASMVEICFNTASSDAHIMHDPNAGMSPSPGTGVLIGRLTNVITLAMHDSLIAANVHTPAWKSDVGYEIYSS